MHHFEASLFELHTGELDYRIAPAVCFTHVYSETCIKRTVAEVPKFISLIYFKWNLY